MSNWYFCDAINGDDTHDGLDQVGLSLSGASFDISTMTLTSSGAFGAVSVGEVLHIETTDRGGESGWYTIDTKTDSDNVVLSLSNGAGLTGSSTNVSSSSGPWANIQKGIKTIPTGMHHELLIADGTYTESGTGLDGYLLFERDNLDVTIRAVDGATPTLATTNASYAVCLSTIVHDVILEMKNLRIAPSSGASSGCLVHGSDDSQVILDGCTLVPTTCGVWVRERSTAEPGRSVEIRNGCVIEEGSTSAVVAEDLDRLIITDSTLYANLYAGMAADRFAVRCFGSNFGTTGAGVLLDIDGCNLYGGIWVMKGIRHVRIHGNQIVQDATTGGTHRGIECGLGYGSEGDEPLGTVVVEQNVVSFPGEANNVGIILGDDLTDAVCVGNRILGAYIAIQDSGMHGLIAFNRCIGERGISLLGSQYSRVLFNSVLSYGTSSTADDYNAAFYCSATSGTDALRPVKNCVIKNNIFDASAVVYASGAGCGYAVRINDGHFNNMVDHNILVAGQRTLALIETTSGYQGVPDLASLQAAWSTASWPTHTYEGETYDEPLHWQDNDANTRVLDESPYLGGTTGMLEIPFVSEARGSSSIENMDVGGAQRKELAPVGATNVGVQI